MNMLIACDKSQITSYTNRTVLYFFANHLHSLVSS